MNINDVIGLLIIGLLIIGLWIYNANTCMDCVIYLISQILSNECDIIMYNDFY